MGAIETKTFLSGNGVAVALPEALGIAPGTPVTIEQIGDDIRIRATPAEPELPTESKRKLSELIARLRALGPITPVGKREPIEWPDRPGLY